MGLCVKTHDLELLHNPPAIPDNTLPGVVRSQSYLGGHRAYIVDVGQEILIAAPVQLRVPTGADVFVRFDPKRCRGLSR